MLNFTFILIISVFIKLHLDQLAFILIFELEMVQGQNLHYGIMNLILKITLLFMLNYYRLTL
jgi:hypothetical protein